jgi:hypothetical protein
MLALSDNVLGQARQGNRAWIHVVRILGWGGADVLWASGGENLIYPVGTVWSGRRFSFEGGPEGGPLTITDPMGIAARACLANSPQGLSVTVWRAWLETLDNSYAEAPYSEEGWDADPVPLRQSTLNWNVVALETVAANLEVGEVQYGDASVTFALRAPSADVARQSPGRTYASGCHLLFKGPDCAYAGAETTCDRTYDTCKNTMANQLNFGGNPLLVARRY